MKVYCVICVLLIANLFYSQTNPFMVVPENISCAPKNICGVNNSLFTNVLSKNSAKYKLIYTWTYFCKPCREFLPKIEKFAKDNEDKLQIYYITDIQKNDQLRSTVKVMNINELYSPVYNIVQKSPNKKMADYEYFVSNIDPTLVLRRYGYSLVILLDKNNNVLYHSNLEDNDDMKLQNIQSVLK